MHEYIKQRQERMGMNVDKPIVHAHVKKTSPGITLHNDREAMVARAYKHFADIKLAPTTLHTLLPRTAEKKPLFNKSFDLASFLKKK